MTTLAPEFSSCIETLKRGGSIDGTSLEALMDLRRDEQDFLAGEWANIPAGIRLDLMDRVAERTAADVTADFTALSTVAIDDDQAEVRRFAVEVLAESMEWRAGRKLVNTLRTDADELVRTAAAASLEDWALRADAGDLDDEQRKEIISALRTASLDSDNPPEVRAASLISLAGISEDWVEPLIADFYYDEDRLLRLAAVTAMGASGLEVWLDFLDEQLQSDDAEFRLAAVTSVGELGIQSTVEAIGALLDDEDDDVVAGAIAALGEIGGPVAVEYLSAFLEDAEPEYIDAVETALEYARDPAFSGYFEEEDDDEAVERGRRADHRRFAPEDDDE